jgi:hypothetical protein
MKGTDLPPPSSRGRIGLIIAGVLGILLIPALLFGTVFASLGTAREKSADAKRISDLGQLQLAEELYFDTNGRYSDTLDQLTEGNFIARVPFDSADSAPYAYSPLEGGRGYVIGASLLRADNPVLMTMTSSAHLSTRMMHSVAAANSADIATMSPSLRKALRCSRSPIPLRRLSRHCPLFP